MNGVIVYLFGYAGCGKLTIARALQAKYDCILVDNHYINNVIFSLLDSDGNSKLPDQVWEQVELIRSAVLNTIRHLSKPNRSFIFTNELLEGEPRAEKVFQAIANVAKDREAAFLPVRLTISPQELARRVISPGRAEHYKETNPDQARKKAQERSVYKPRDIPYLEIDITTLSPDETAKMILEEIHRNR